MELKPLNTDPKNNSVFLLYIILSARNLVCPTNYIIDRWWRILRCLENYTQLCNHYSDWFQVVSLKNITIYLPANMSDVVDSRSVSSVMVELVVRITHSVEKPYVKVRKGTFIRKIRHHNLHSRSS